jgi:peptide/nickel transport system permease protein
MAENLATPDVVTPGTGAARRVIATGPGPLLARLLRRPAGATASAWVLLLVLACALATWVAPYGPLEQDLAHSNALPSGAHLLGTDQLGRDILSRMLYGGRVSLVAVLEAVVVFVVVGLILGLLAGYAGGLVDRIVMRGADILMAIPLVVTLLIVLAVFSRNETAAMITFGFLAAAGLVRVTRAATLAVKNDDYVRAAEVAGLRPGQIVVRHVLPRVLPPVVIQASLLAGSALLVESGLNYLGLGVQPPHPSWGGAVADASTLIYKDPWVLVPSGGVIVLTALAFGVIGDVVRDLTADRTAAAPASWRQLVTRARRTPRSVAPSEAYPDSDPLVRLRGLRVGKGDVTLVDGVDLDIRAGEIIGIVGESGCGKSLTISALLRLLPPGLSLEAESYRLDGSDALVLPEREVAVLRGRTIAFVPQEPVAGLDPAFTVLAQLRELVRHHDGGSRASAEARVRELLEQVGLPDPERVLRSHPHELSGGMAQRVAIARALAGRPRILLADEPTTALDVTVQAGILALLRRLRDETGLAVVIVTHDWGVVSTLCDRAVVMYAGETVEQGAVEDLLERPRHPYTRALLQANPKGAGFRERLRSIPGVVPPPDARGDGCRFAPRCTRALPDCLAGPVPLLADPGVGEDRASTAVFRCINPEPVQEADDVHAL